MNQQTISKLLRTLGFVATICLSHIIYAQAPQAIPYQGVARDASGNILANQNISLRISIRDLTATGAIVFSEVHNITTTSLGLFNVNIGQGVPVSGALAGTNWGTGAKFIQVEMDPAGGSSYTDMGTTQLMSVPYALFAGSSGNIPSGTGNGNTLRWNGTQWVADNAIYNNGTNVGIGTTTPAWKLHLAGTVTGLQIQDTDDASSIFLFAPGNGYTGGVGTTSNHDLALFTNNLDRMTIKAGTGNVGIGTLSPSEKLDVIGKTKTTNFQMTNGAAANTILTGDASGNAAWTAVSSLSIIEVDPEVSSSTTNRVPKWNGTSLTDGIITDNGNNVGIGTSSPTRKLHLSGTIADLRIDDSDDGSSIWLSAPGAGYTGGVGTTSNHDLALFTNSIDRMTVKAGTGNVGIGTLNPSTKLEVIAPGNNIGVQILSGDPNQLTYLSVGRTTSEAQFGVTTNSTFFLDATPGDLAIKNFGLTPGKILLGSSYIDNAAMAIVPGNKVGIGTTTPNEKLEVVNNSFTGVGRFKNINPFGYSALDFMDTNNDMKLGIGFANTSAWIGGNSYIHSLSTPLLLLTQNTERMRIETNGNVGIGTSTPSTRLEVVAPGNNIGVQILSGNPNELTYLSVGRTTSEAQFGVTTSGTFFLDANPGDLAIKNFGLTPGKILFGSSYIDNSAMAIVPGGNVGIGTSNPGYKLDIAGQENVTHAVQAGYTNSNIITSSTSNFFPRIALQYNGTNNGASILGTPLGELNVLSNTTNNFTNVNASGFVVISDRRMKNNIREITHNDYDFYLNQIRSIESAKFLYNYETERLVPHIGVISQSLPIELQSEVNENPGQESEKRIGVSLADMAGLTLVGVKALDFNQQQMQTQLDEQAKIINALLNTVEQLKDEVESLKNN